MAKNTDKGYREGEVKGRSQVYNSKIEKWVERDSGTGKFKHVKSNDEPYKGVRKEK